MCKVYELTDSFTGQSFGYIHNNTKKYAKSKLKTNVMMLVMKFLYMK